MSNLEDLLEEMSHYKRPKKELLQYYVNLRLQKSLQTYYKDLDNSIKYLEKRNAARDERRNRINEREFWSHENI